MAQHILESELDRIPFFDMNELMIVFPNIKLSSLRQKMKRWMDKGKLIQLCKGIYMTREYFQANQADNNFRVFIANSLLLPSYVSGAYVLQRYDILTDITYSISSVSLKSSRKYENKLGQFIYNSISEDLYTGYTTEFYNSEKVYIASKAKALFDFLYFKYWSLREFPDDLLDYERFDLSSFTKTDKKEFEKYCNLSRGDFYKQLPKLLFYE